MPQLKARTAVGRGGYGVVRLVYGGNASALVSLPRNLIQAGLSVVLAVVAVYIVKLPSLLKKQGVNVGTDKTAAEDVSSQNGEISSTGNTHGQ